MQFHRSMNAFRPTDSETMKSETDSKDTDDEGSSSDINSGNDAFVFLLLTMTSTLHVPLRFGCHIPVYSLNWPGWLTMLQRLSRFHKLPVGKLCGTFGTIRKSILYGKENSNRANIIDNSTICCWHRDCGSCPGHGPFFPESLRLCPLHPLWLLTVCEWFFQSPSHRLACELLSLSRLQIMSCHGHLTGRSLWSSLPHPCVTWRRRRLPFTPLGSATVLAYEVEVLQYILLSTAGTA